MADKQSPPMPLDAAANEAWRRFKRENPDLTFEHRTAFQHVYGSAVLAKAVGPGIAQALGEAREGWTWGQAVKRLHGPRDSCADHYNNALGRRIAKGLSDSELADAAMQAVLDGRAIVHRVEAGADPRIPADVTRYSKPGDMAHHAVMRERADFEARSGGKPAPPPWTLKSREEERPWAFVIN